MRRALALTTINGSDNRCLRLLSEGASAAGIPFFIAGDTKTPAGFSLPGSTYLSIAEQTRRYPALAALLPTKHYTRKNIAYLAAMEWGAQEIQETDDDNFPRQTFWQSTTAAPMNVDAVVGTPWANVYRMFTDARIWPRGFPLEYALSPTPLISGRRLIDVPLILQGLADQNPDVDAVFRMTCDLPVSFKRRDPVFLLPGSWCPFNSQNTLFNRAVFPLMYLPSYCSFRMTDIWRSLVAQRCLWEMGEGLIFHDATVVQDRNDHNLLRDFSDEVPGYLHDDSIRVALEATALDAKDLHRSVYLCYEKMVADRFVDAAELPLVRSWSETMDRILR
jgi:hypothetical protein